MLSSWWLTVLYSNVKGRRRWWLSLCCRFYSASCCMWHKTKISFIKTFVSMYLQLLKFGPFDVFQICQRTACVSCQRSCVSSSPWRHWACTTMGCGPCPPASATCRLSPTSTSGNSYTPQHVTLITALHCLAVALYSVVVSNVVTNVDLQQFLEPW